MPLSIGCNASSLIFVNVGAMTNRLRNNASPITTWFGGIDGRPSALRVSDSTMTMRVKLVSMTRSAGATASTVSRRMMMMLWPGFLLPLPSREPKSTLIDASLCFVVGVLTTGGVGADGGVTAGAGLTGAGLTGAAPAAFNDTLAHPHASAQMGSPITTRILRNHVRREARPNDVAGRGPWGPRERFGTKTLPGS